MSISDGIKIIDETKKIAKDHHDKNLNEQIINLQEYLISLSEENLELQNQINELKSKVEIPEDIDIDNDGFIVKKGDDRKYCPGCWNKERKLSLMPRKGIDRLGVHKYSHRCAACGTIVDTETENY
ncbi:hypothetical protein OZX56_05315 [Lactobacillus sp. ESL0684]|uniref:hypothetical protein n=1 Tax=Lactobacillus sp. ESL0684 TaxID=2983213 RepID=UPI0023F9EF30|nr:hypothetical protein [Lactobacillus sp. ESL0684]WEV42969.1 hypothetical protein OZX56_05315 [Lactobacillus sp. ESL0684]